MAKKSSKRAPSNAAAARIEAPARHPGPDWLVVAIAAVGLLITAYLSIVAFRGTAPVLCTAGSSCDLIQQSHWSRLFGVPIALWGFLTYALIAGAALLPSTRLRRWRRIWTLSLIGVGISLYLTVIGLVQLQAACGWCLASLVTMSALFVVASVRRPPSAPGTPWLNWSVGNAALLLGLLGVMHLAYGGWFSPRPEPRLQALAAHLKETGAVFYGAAWCQACSRQKDAFGGAAKDLPYVECSPGGRGGPFAMECLNAGIESFPTWIIRGKRYEDLLAPDDLAKRSGFAWETPTAKGAPGP